MTKEQIKKCMMDAVGNPVNGVVADSAEAMAQAVYDCLNPEVKETKKTYKVEKETREENSEETR